MDTKEQARDVIARWHSSVPWTTDGPAICDVDYQYADAILSALDGAGLVIEQGWQDIETAPKDGTEILVLCPYEGAGLVFWFSPLNNHRGGWQPCSFDEGNWGGRSEPAPTHWRPLPTSPSAPSPVPAREKTVAESDTI